MSANEQAALRLPVAGVRVDPTVLRAAQRRWRRWSRVSIGALVLFFAVASLWWFHILAATSQWFNGVLTYLVALMGIAVLAYHLYDRGVAEPYPPNVLGSSLSERMHEIMNILARKQKSRDRLDELQAKQGEIAIAFSSFFGRRPDLFDDRPLVRYEDGRTRVADEFVESVAAFDRAVNGKAIARQSTVQITAHGMLSAYRHLMREMKVDIWQIEPEAHAIDPIHRTDIGHPELPAPANLLGRAQSRLRPELLPAVKRIIDQNARLDSLADHLSPEDRDEWSRIIGAHLPQLEDTFVTAHDAVREKQDVQEPFVRALGYISGSLDLIIARTTGAVVNDFAVSTRFIELAHRDDLTTT
ncbi:hypothetical protein [Sphingomonas sp. TX0522]|uniref:hypothetical protein n=1 Tax=Sphingomonas sp. TX0522 TaxID=2479205 RepID=UPI0018DF1AD6|nr:hypothetical protein [Sphingomonas sp. TX0522]MBI0533018.1 hypothetical protein [Sphingomonas sp. TX0522]